MTLTKVTYAMIEGTPISVLDYGAVGDGSTDDTAAIQAAVDEWLDGDEPKQLIFPQGKYKITDVILCSPQQNTSAVKSLIGYGAEIINNSATKAFKFITSANKKFWANAVIEGLTVRGGVDCFSFEAGGNVDSDWMWQFTLKNLNAFEFSGTGFYCYNGFFESAFYSCVAWGLDTNTTGYGFKFENGATSVISSIDIYNVNTRYCKNGIRTISPVADVDIYGGTVLFAYEEGIYFEFSAGNVLTGVHVEGNFQSGSGSIRPAIRIIGSAVVSGIYAQSNDAAKQNYAIRVYVAGQSVVNGGNIGGVGHTKFAYYESAGGTNDTIASFGVSYTTSTNVNILSFSENGFVVPAITLKNNFVPFAASVTPNLDNGTYFRVDNLTNNITVNNPTFSGTIQTGTLLIVVLSQDGTGGRTVTWGSKFLGTGAISSGAGTWSIWTFVYDGANWRQTAYNNA